MLLKVTMIAIGILSLGLGILSAFWPGKSIGLYQWIMKCYNWKVEPIDAPREIHNTRLLGWGLILLGAILSVLAAIQF
jgi:hypothetical protein